LWSNDSLHCKTHVSIPLYNESRSAVVTPTQLIQSKQPTGLDTLTEQQDTSETVNDFFKRIDSNVKQTKKAVKRLNKKN
jgi:hypothetical protein